MPTRSLTGAVVAVVGASGGLGSRIAHLLAERGAVLILAGPHADRLQALAAEVGSTAVVAPCDLRDSRCGDTIIEAASSVGRLDGLVNAAGVVAFGSLVDTPDDLIEEVFLINTLGPIWLMKRLAPLLSESKGFIVNISAVVAESPLPNMAAYSASKAALTAADTALAREFRRIGISVCDVRPPHTETGLADRPISGVAPKLPAGLMPDAVAQVIVNAIESGEAELSAAAFV
jgi:short-subunit dehydrogenase